MTAFDDKQITVTLAALAYVTAGKDATTAPAEEQQLLDALEAALALPSLATQGEWSVVWLGLTDTQGNLAYVVRHNSEDKLAVVVRGTVFGPTWEALYDDACQDTEVGVVDSFLGVDVSRGANVAYTAILGARMNRPGYPGSGGTLMEALAIIIGTGKPTIYVTGHSLGGCAATMIALRLHNDFPDCVYQVHTYAAPTAGLAEFAKLFDKTFAGGATDTNSSWRVVNAWDVIPQAWSSLDTPRDNWYPAPGPTSDEAYAALEYLSGLPGDNVYVQPSTNLDRLNGEDFGKHLWDPCNGADADTSAACKDRRSYDPYVAQLYFQHSVVEAYMTLVDAPPLPRTTFPATAESQTAGTAAVTLTEPGFVHALELTAA